MEISQQLFRAFDEPNRTNPSYDERWGSDDLALITCWEVGRKIRAKDPELADLAIKGELPVLGLKGGVENKIQKEFKYGTLHYLAQWQGLRGEDLNIDMAQETELVCQRTGMRVVFTLDANKYLETLLKEKK